MEIEFHPPEKWHDYKQCEEIQRQVWPTPDNSDIVPASLLVTAEKNGGLLLGAFQGRQMIGFVFGFLGAEGEGTSWRLKHCSHMLAVLDGYRGRGIGLELKKRQREELIARGLELATWTYDPLQIANARLNLARLGGIARRYLRDAYGEMSDPLNAGVPSDRFMVEWWLSSARVERALAYGGEPEYGSEPPAQPVYEMSFDGPGRPRVVEETALPPDTAWVEIPTDFNGLRAAEPEAARAWRARTRATFERAFSTGFSAVRAGFWRDKQGRRRAGYVLERTI
ncbi:MAG: hypothetical protein ACM3JD_19915 [Rudaea sp.]